MASIWSSRIASVSQLEFTDCAKRIEVALRMALSTVRIKSDCPHSRVRRFEPQIGIIIVKEDQ